jgi:hypothetical protein
MFSALLGGALIGFSASLAHAGGRQVVGVSGILGSLFRWPLRPFGFAVWFVLGLVLGGVLMWWLAPGVASTLAPRSGLWIVVSGLLVGFGTRLGSGCTSGHGVCGLSRLSSRSLVATCVFIATAAVTVLFARHALGGLP